MQVLVCELHEDDLPKQILLKENLVLLLVVLIMTIIDVKQITFYVNYLLLHMYGKVSITT
jgi:hypothetical protein